MKISFKFLVLLLFAGNIVACQSSTPTDEQSADETTQETTAETNETDVNGESFGAEFAPESVISYSDLLVKAEGEDSLQVQVRATVAEVCQMKGCWMNLVASESGPSMMVRFKDYGFFMPKDIAGREVIVEGVAFRQLTSVDELRHYAEDAGKSEEEIAAITEPKEELAFLASGVILLEE